MEKNPKQIPCHRIKLICADVYEELLLKIVSFHITSLPYKLRCKLPSILPSHPSFLKHICQQLAPFMEFWWILCLQESVQILQQKSKSQSPSALSLSKWRHVAVPLATFNPFCPLLKSELHILLIFSHPVSVTKGQAIKTIPPPQAQATVYIEIWIFQGSGCDPDIWI